MELSICNAADAGDGALAFGRRSLRLRRARYTISLETCARARRARVGPAQLRMKVFAACRTAAERHMPGR